MVMNDKWIHLCTTIHQSLMKCVKEREICVNYQFIILLQILQRMGTQNVSCHFFNLSSHLSQCCFLLRQGQIIKQMVADGKWCIVQIVCDTQVKYFHEICRRFPWKRLPNRMCYRQKCKYNKECCRRYNLCDKSAKVSMY